MKREIHFRLSIPEAIVVGHRLAQDADPNLQIIGDRLLKQYYDYKDIYDVYLIGLKQKRKELQKRKKRMKR